MEKTDSILDFSPFGSSATKKRPASEIAASTTAAKVSPSFEDEQNKKRATTCSISKSSSSTSLFSDTIATMTEDESQAILKKTCLPKAPKKQSQYVRFKSLMLKQAKADKDKETQENITTVAKEAWNMVKDKSVANVSIADTSSDSKLDKYMRLKAQVVADEQKEASDYSTELEKFKSNYLDAAVSFLYWETKDASSSTLEQFEKEVKSIHSNVITAWSGNDVPSKYTEIYKTAQAKLDTLQKDSAISKIVSQLRNASEEVLYQHALEHYNLQQQLVELNTLKAKAAALETEKANEEAKQMVSAYSIKSDICRDLKKLMVYTGPQLKYSSKKISCRRKGVTPKMFAVAFGVAEGVKSFTFDGDEVGLKSLRYGYLSCGKVTVKLIGDAVSASTSYSL
ncbi:hypothetical protein CTEN210_18001 [Chaetoceros tenuissimus]|uniref:Uncharacterized protein n=1 Tax=Chaetoceros tenuissimus TaxID=426638 RepID=A0AAD3DEI0_9STRA|nr:hypothetical protein CTEN210_18001 [Chaetoceros tenuissimus]